MNELTVVSIDVFKLYMELYLSEDWEPLEPPEKEKKQEEEGKPEEPA